MIEEREDRIIRHLTELGVLREAQAFCLRRGFALRRVISRARPPQLARVRHELWIVTKHSLDLSSVETGRVFQVDHSTVLTAEQKVLAAIAAEHDSEGDSMASRKNKIAIIMARQGDVLFIPAPDVEVGEEIRPVMGRHVLAEGEHSGHVHAVDAADARMFRQKKDSRGAREDRIDRILEVTRKAIVRIEGLQSRTVQDERHTPIELPPGKYKVRIMREFRSGMVRRVED